MVLIGEVFLQVALGVHVLYDTLLQYHTIVGRTEALPVPRREAIIGATVDRWR